MGGFIHKKQKFLWRELNQSQHNQSIIFPPTNTSTSLIKKETFP